MQGLGGVEKFYYGETALAVRMSNPQEKGPAWRGPILKQQIGQTSRPKQLGVDGFFQRLAGLEFWNFGSRDLDRLAGARVAAG